MRILCLAVLVVLAGCAEAPPQGSQEVEPPWGYTKFCRDNPGSRLCQNETE